MSVSNHPYVGYWNVPAASVPTMTGALTVMDCRDLADALDGLRIVPPLKDVLDVGCGTGRFSRLCDGYLGLDISPGAIEYATKHGCAAGLISGPDDVAGRTAEWVTCFSVFTHIGRDERRAYLEVFHTVAPNLVADILPGVEGGSPAVWRADPSIFEHDLKTLGYRIVADYERTAPDGTNHRYYRCER